jgi:hypothetical protein
METSTIIRLGLIGFAIVGISYACIGTGFLRGGQSGWWDALPKEKKRAFAAAIAASVLQTFL